MYFLWGKGENIANIITSMDTMEIMWTVILVWRFYGKISVDNVW